MLKGKKIGFVGAGNMGGAIAKGLIAAGKVTPADILVADIDRTKAEEFGRFGACIMDDAAALAAQADVVVLAVKPQVMDDVLLQLKPYPAPLYVSLAAGITIGHIQQMLGSDVRVVRTMPNTPALVGEGMTVISTQPPVTSEDTSLVRALFESVGLVEQLPEHLLNAVGSVSGSSPAYVYMLIEAMADAAVADGIPRATAYTLAAQAVAGSARMVLETKQHPGALKDNVCSPGGTTIRAVAHLEQSGFRGAIMGAMKECTKRSEEISK